MLLASLLIKFWWTLLLALGALGTAYTTYLQTDEFFGKHPIAAVRDYVIALISILILLTTLGAPLQDYSWLIAVGSMAPGILFGTSWTQGGDTVAPGPFVSIRQFHADVRVAMQQLKQRRQPTS
jgi:hypothetical protein